LFYAPGDVGWLVPNEMQRLFHYSHYGAHGYSVRPQILGVR
jgi:hypothetical protein